MHGAGDPDPARADWRMTLRATARGAGFVALAFSVVVALLLLADCHHAGQAQTVRAEALGQALATARQAPADSTAVAFARDLDRVARHAYFSSVTFRAHGILLLAVGLLVAVGLLHLADRLVVHIEDPRRVSTGDPVRADRMARQAILATGVVALSLALLWQGPEHPAAVSAPALTSTTPAPRVQPAPATPSTGTAWSCFRGPWCGVSPWTNAPVTWDGASGAGVVWKREVQPASPNSPAIWGQRVFLTTGNERERAVLAFDLASGAELWRQAVTDGGAGEALPATTPDTGLAASTVACDAAGVYAVFGTGDLAAFTHDGKKRWQIFLRRPDNPYGHASSLLADGGRIYVQFDQSDAGEVLALDAADGHAIWQVDRSRGPAWSSPILATDDRGRSLLVANGHEKVSAFAPSDGRLVWEAEGVSGEVAPSPAFASGRLYLANAYARLVCYKLEAEPRQQWASSDILPDVASPVAAGGLLFIATSDGQLACLDAVDGHEQWKQSFDTGFYASPIVSGDRLYALDRDGVMRIVAAQRIYHEIARCPLGEAAGATPAFGDGFIILRSGNHLWRVGGR